MLVLAVLVAAATTVEAQFRPRLQRGFGNVRLATPDDFDGSFHFCRIVFNGDGRGDNRRLWNVDLPRADINLSIRLSELTKTTVGKRATASRTTCSMRLTDHVLFQCPFIMMTEVGSASINEARPRSCATTC